jgi:cytochrome c oxidase subunit 1/cytochrome c oxidase subunit I+III
MSTTASPELEPAGPETPALPAHAPEAHAPTTAAPGALYSWFTTVDHKKIGTLYLLTAVLFFAVGGIEALVIRLQLARPNNTLVSPDTFNQLFTMHGTTMIFLVVMPALSGFANYLVPLMIGARDMAFPRLNAFAYWTLPLGGFLLHFSVLAGGAPSAGWFSYAPLSETAYSSTMGTDYWILAVIVLGIGSVSTALNIIATVITLRAPGLTMQRLPLFVWMTFVTQILVILALPVLNASLAMLLIDRQLDAHFFTGGTGGGNAVLWEHFFWAFGHPEVYILALPAFGMISEIIPVYSRKPIFGYEFVAASTVAIAILSFGVWAHHMFAVGMGHTTDLFFAAGSMLIAVPTGVKVFNWVATMWGGSLRFTTAMMFAVAFLLEFVVGGLSGITFAAAPIDWQVTDTYYLVAHFHYVAVGGVAFAMLGATYHWFPKMTGRLLSEKLGRANFWLMIVGFNMTFFVQHFLGIMGMPRRVFTYPDLPGWGALNLVSTVGAFIMGFALLLFLVNIAVSLRSGQVAGDNPWDAWTLEWATTSPPPEHNFFEVPPVHGRRPLYDLAHAPAAPPPAEGPLVPAAAEGGAPAAEHTGRLDKLDKFRVMMWGFIASETSFFGVLILSFGFYNARLEGGPTAASSLDVGKTAAFTVCLFASSLTLHQAEKHLEHGKGAASVRWLLVTVILGLVFLVGQAHEYIGLFDSGISVATNLFTTSFFTLTGFHGLHVTIGLVALTIILGLASQRRQPGSPGSKGDTGEHPQLVPLKTIGLYWHFVDVVWLVVFTIVYLRAK